MSSILICNVLGAFADLIKQYSSLKAWLIQEPPGNPHHASFSQCHPGHLFSDVSEFISNW